MANIKVPVLIFAGNTDGIAPVNSVKALVKLLPNAHEVRFEIVPGGHLGMLTGRAARGTTWVTMDEWIEQYSTPDEKPQRVAAKKATGRKKSTGKPAAKRPAAVVAPGTASTTDADSAAAPDRSAIGSNPERRFASAASRNLHRKP